MVADSEHLAALSARVFSALPRSARDQDGAWDALQVSATLREVHASLERQLAAQEADFARVTADLEMLRDAAPLAVLESQDKVHDVARELEDLEPAVENAVSHFAALVELLEPATYRLQSLDARAKYLAIAIEIERRSQETKRSAAQATSEALDAFSGFAAFVQTIPSEYGALRKEAMRRVDELSLGIKAYAVEKLQTALDAIEWPRMLAKEELEKETAKLAEIARAFAYLVTLHVSQLQAETPHEKQANETENEAAVDLWAIECVLEPIRMRFKYHFERAESKTNRVTKPEWWLSHVLDQTRAHGEFLSSVLNPELKKHRETLDCVDAQVLFLRGLVRTAKHKLQKDLPVILSERVVFCHTLDEVLLFEQAVNHHFGYDSYASSSPARFPRVVDVLTNDPKTLFAWTRIDAEYATETLETSILTHKDAWTWTASKVPPVSQQFVALLDFMCRRFAHFSNEGHRYVYITQVLYSLLHVFHQHCSAHARQLSVQRHVESRQSLVPFFSVVNAAQHIVTVLDAWDENAFFIELMRKVAESDQSRTQILKMHLQHSKTVLTNAAKAATKTILAREEAVAVHQAIAGPGAMIGPTAALSAAYSVGSKTVKSLFGRGEGSPVPGDQTPPPAATETPPLEPEEPQEIDAEALLFSRTIFERQVRDYKTLIAALIGDVEQAVGRSWRKALDNYRKSLLWSQSSTPESIDRDVSSELAPVVDLLQRVLVEAHSHLRSEESFSQLWKPLIAALDDAIFSTACSIMTNAAASSGSGFSLSDAATAIGAVEPLSPRARTNEPRPSWSTAARGQFAFDMNAIALVVQRACKKNPRAYLRKTLDLCRLVEMPSTKLSEIHEALRGVDEGRTGGDDMEQITTILEACTILTLTPQQVLTFCEAQLGLK